MSSSNLPSITVSTFTKIVEMQFEERIFRPIFGLGKGGIGKTESIYDLAVKKLKIGYIDIRLLLYNETDLKGIPYPDSNHTKTIWLQNDILPLEERDGEKGIIVLDEITSCCKSVRTAAYQLLNERKLGEYSLPEGWMIVCLGNGEEDGGDYQGVEGNFVNRCSLYNVVSDVEDWKNWAIKNNINSLITSYISFKPADLHTYSEESQTELIFASPRSWVAVSDIINIHSMNSDDKITRSRVIANLGLRVASQFFAFCKYKKYSVDPMSIIKSGAKPNITQQEVLYITIGSVVKIIGDKIKADLENSDGAAITPEATQWLANGLDWILNLSVKEYAIMGFKDLVSYDEKSMRMLLVNPALHQACPKILEFANENKEIFK